MHGNVKAYLTTVGRIRITGRVTSTYIQLMLNIGRKARFDRHMLKPHVPPIGQLRPGFPTALPKGFIRGA